MQLTCFSIDMKILTLTLSLLLATTLTGQWITGLHTDWDHSFRDWQIEAVLADSTLLDGSLDVTFQIDEDFSEYSWRLGDDYGSFRQVFANNPTNWELRYNNELVSVRSVWPSDPREWKISTPEQSFTISTRYPGVFDEWVVKTKGVGEFYMYTEVPGDTRDWIVEDYMVDDIGLAMRLAIIFVVAHISSPKI